jgi:hypothetical protein
MAGSARLKEVFGFSLGEISGTLDRSEASVRQVGSPSHWRTAGPMVLADDIKTWVTRRE